MTECLNLDGTKKMNKGLCCLWIVVIQITKDLPSEIQFITSD